MIELELDKKTGIAKIKPIFPLEKKDFSKIVKVIDPYIKDNGNLKGLIIYSEHFPRWKNFKAMLSHVKFVKNHHKNIRKIAAITHSKVLNILFDFIQPFLKADVRHYDFNKADDAITWILSS